MDKSALMDMVLDKIMGELDDVEGSSAMAHSAEECPDPLTCSQHDGELGEHLTPAEGPDGEIEKGGLPSMDGAKAEDADPAGELSPEEAEELRKLLKQPE